MARPDPSQGVFETLLVRDGRVQTLGAHLDRLAASLSSLYAAPAPDTLRAEIVSTAHSLRGKHRMRVDAVPASAGVRVTVTTSPLGAPQLSTATAVPITISGGLGAHKWRDRRRIDALAEQAGRGGVVLICDDDEQVLEAGWANVWLLEDDRLRTAPADGRILPGVTRARLLSMAPSLGLDTSESPITRRDLQTAPAVFLTSSLRVVMIATSTRPPGPANARIAAITDALAARDWS